MSLLSASRHHVTGRAAITCAAAIAAVLAGAPVPAFSAEATAAAASRRVQFNIAAQPLVTALQRYSEQAKVQVTAPSELVRQVQAPALRGEYDVVQALRTMLEGTGLSFEFINESAVAIRAATGNIGQAGTGTMGITQTGNSHQRGFSSGLRLAQAPQANSAAAGEDRADDRDAQSCRKSPDDPSCRQTREALAEIIVTGTNIRGAEPVGARITAMGRDGIDRRGFTTVTEALRSLPQAINLGHSEALTPVAQNSNLNYGRGSSINLRGVGADATLVLLDGQRLAPSGTGAFVDISLLPLSAIERIEVLTDGASAIYGSDAVGGVVNVITRKRMDGFAFEGDTAFADGYDTRRASVAGGFDWNGGNMVVSGEYRHSSDLKAIDRYYARQDLTAFGGTDQRGMFCSPGTITANGVNYAIPSGQNGVGLSPDSLVAGTQNLCDGTIRGDLLPESERWSTLAHVEQAFGRGITFYADGLYSRRRSAITSGNGANLRLTVPRSNPFFVDLDPALATEVVTYSAIDDLGPLINRSISQSRSVVAGLRIDLTPRWHAELSYAVSRASDERRTENATNAYYLNRLLALSDPALAFNPFGQGGSNSEATLNAIRGWGQVFVRSRARQLRAGLSGSFANPIGADDIMLAFGVDLLSQNYFEGGAAFVSTATPAPLAPTTGRRKDNAGYVELALPVISHRMGIPWARSLTASAAVRRDDYDDFGATTNPRLGLEWELVDGLKLAGSWGTSFKAPLLSQGSPNYSAVVSVVADAASPTGTTTVLQIGKSALPLKAETADTYTIGLTYHGGGESRPLKVSLDYFNVRYEDRIQLFTGVSAATALASPELYGELIVRNPTQAQIEAIQSDPYLNAPFAVPPGGIGAIYSYGYRNIGRLSTDGVDANVSYTWDTAPGKIALSASVTRMLSHALAITSTSPDTDQLGWLGFPNEWRATGSASLMTNRFDASLNVSFIGDYSNSAIVPAQRIPSWTTVDLTGRLLLSGFGLPVAKDAALVLSVRNLFDRDPPMVFGVNMGYDGFSADPIGRTVTIGFRSTF